MATVEKETTEQKPKAPKAKAPAKKAAPKKEQPKAEVEAPKGSMKPEALATELGVTGKNLRGWLRKTHPRAPEQKNTSWIITPDVIKEAREHFKKQEARSAAK